MREAVVELRWGPSARRHKLARTRSSRLLYSTAVFSRKRWCPWNHLEAEPEGASPLPDNRAVRVFVVAVVVRVFVGGGVRACTHWTHRDSAHVLWACNLNLNLNPHWSPRFLRQHDAPPVTGSTLFSVGGRVARGPTVFAVDLQDLLSASLSQARFVVKADVVTQLGLAAVAATSSAALSAAPEAVQHVLRDAVNMLAADAIQRISTLIQHRCATYMRGHAFTLLLVSTSVPQDPLPGQVHPDMNLAAQCLLAGKSKEALQILASNAGALRDVGEAVVTGVTQLLQATESTTSLPAVTLRVARVLSGGVVDAICEWVSRQAHDTDSLFIVTRWPLVAFSGRVQQHLGAMDITVSQCSKLHRCCHLQSVTYARLDSVSVAV